MKQFIFAVLVIFLLSANCKKNDLKEQVINGITFSCKVDDKQYLPDFWDYGNNIPPLRLRFIANTNNAIDLLLIAERSNERLMIYLNYPLIQGRHELKFNTQPFPTYDPPKDNGFYGIKSPYQEFITNEAIGGYVDLVNIDTIAFKVNARFEFTATDKITGKQISVTNGLFRNY